MKIYARQISPEYQESPLFMGDEFFPDNIAVCGNRDYHSHKPELFENVQNVLEQGELAEILEYPKNWADWYKNATQAITEYLPPTNGKKYSTNAIHALRCLVLDYSCCACSKENEIICKVLSIVDGLKDILKKHMEENGLEVLTGNEHKATYKTVVSSRIDTAALKKGHPDIAAQYTKTTETKRFAFA